VNAAVSPQSVNPAMLLLELDTVPELRAALPSSIFYWSTTAVY
jgi:hypothetical protein